MDKLNAVWETVDGVSLKYDRLVIVPMGGLEHPILKLITATFSHFFLKFFMHFLISLLCRKTKMYLPIEYYSLIGDVVM